jgi:hypothetical protein
MPIPPRMHVRLEPRPFERNLAEGFGAPTADPVWFLARQWQMGEHQGENASSPVRVDYTLSSRSISAADPLVDPTVVPAEAIVESEVDDWWTTGRRVRIGRLFAGHPAVQADPTLLFVDAPPPYELFSALPDGLRVWRQRASLGIPDTDFGVPVPADTTPDWDREHLLYQQSGATAFTAVDQELRVQRHRGGRLDWHSVDAAPRGEPAEGAAEQREAVPTALAYPGAPNSRWWQIENAETDLGGYAPDSAHTPTALLTELIFSHSDDWFLFPVTALAGRVVRIGWMQVRDAFGRTYASAEDDAGVPGWPGLQPPEGWTLFRVAGIGRNDPGLPPTDLVLWHVAELPLEGPPVERVQFGLDEQSNLLWAVERMVDGREVESRTVDVPDGARFNEGRTPGDLDAAREYGYVPAEGIVPFWTPYTLNTEEEGGARRLVQRQLVDLSLQAPAAMPAPQAEVLQPDGGAPHRLAPLAVPGNGIEIERRWLLARDMHGQPVLWIRRRRSALLAPPARRLRFDVMAVQGTP